MKYFLNYHLSLDGVYLSGVLNKAGPTASCQAVSCQLGLPLPPHLSLYFKNSGAQLCLKNPLGFTGCGGKKRAVCLPSPRGKALSLEGTIYVYNESI